MTTLIATSGALGTRRCDEKCHGAAPGTPCECICGGRYHAVGDFSTAQRMLTEEFFGRDKMPEDLVAAVRADGRLFP